MSAWVLDALLIGAPIVGAIVALKKFSEYGGFKPPKDDDKDQKGKK